MNGSPLASAPDGHRRRRAMRSHHSRQMSLIGHAAFKRNKLDWPIRLNEHHPGGNQAHFHNVAMRGTAETSLESAMEVTDAKITNLGEMLAQDLAGQVLCYVAVDLLHLPCWQTSL